MEGWGVMFKGMGREVLPRMVRIWTECAVREQPVQSAPAWSGPGTFWQHKEASAAGASKGVSGRLVG